MGLMYLFPVEDTDLSDDRVNKNGEGITLKTYGLPMIFWGYLAAILSVVFVMWIASLDIIAKMLTYNDPLLTFLAYLVRGFLIIGPTILVGFYFYEKFLIKHKNTLTIIHRVFFIPIKKETLKLNSTDAFLVNHFMDSPNVAKLKNEKELKGFENKGYFELHALVNDKKIFIDRSSRKEDLLKLKDLLSKY